MKTIMKLKNLNLIVSLLLFVSGANAQIVNIPDANFKALLLSASDSNTIAQITAGSYVKIDTNNDGEIQNSEALVIRLLYLPPVNYEDVTGIESFANLTHFGCSESAVSNLDFSMLAELTVIHMNNNSLLNTINLSGLVNLKAISCTRNNALTSIDISGSTNLISISCYGNAITSLDVSNRLSLTMLSVYDNQLTSLNVTGCIALTTIDCGGNPLVTLNVSGLKNLTNLDVYGMQTQLLTSIDASGCISLRNFGFNDGNLVSADFSGCTSLISLQINFNELSSLNISGCAALQNLDLFDNKLTTLNLSDFTALTDINVNDNLFTTFDVSNCNVLEYLNIRNNPLTTLFIKNGANESISASGAQLQFVCADNSQISQVKSVLQSGGAINAIVNSYCSFIPGGDYNTVSGNTRFDIDNNGCDTNDIIPLNVRIDIDNGTASESIFTDTQGKYSFYTPAGNFTMTPGIENPNYYNFSPSVATVQFPLLDNSTQIHDFCISANGVHPDVEIVIIPNGVARPGFDASYKIIYKNKGNQTASGTITLAFDDARTDYVSAVPAIATQAGNLLLWNFSNLQPFETRTIDFTLNINTPLENPSVDLGDVLHSTVSIGNIYGDEMPQDNIFDLDQIVINAVDPNDKTCLEGNTVTPENIGKYLHYNINFENVGTADAVNIVIKDTIDTDTFDIKSLQVLYTSHTARTKITGNIVEFIFENISLPPSNISPIGGHGNVLFKIKTKPDLVIGDEVANTANIYFDYNAPIETNEARTKFALLGNPDFKKDSSIVISPNPAKNNISVRANSNLKSIQLFDVQGRILQTSVENKNSTTIDIGNHQKGIYFLRITTNTGTVVEKIIKE